jgi:hypothetical protein
VGDANLNEESKGEVDVPLLACGANAPRHVELDGLRECGLVENHWHAGLPVTLWNCDGHES